MNLTWINGTFVEDKNACLHVSDLAIQRGYGVFDFFRCKQKKPFLLSCYLKRFYNSAQGLNLEVPLEQDEMIPLIYEFIARNQLVDQGIKLILTGGYSEDSYTPTKSNLIIRGHRIKAPTAEQYQKGFRVIINEYQRGTPGCKSIDYRHGISLLPILQERRLDDVLYHFNGVISELPRSNFFIIDQSDRIITPGRNILEGITRSVLLHVAKAYYDVEIRDVFVDELLIAKEAFLTSTTKLVMPICEIDGRPVGDGIPGPITRHLSELMEQLPADFELSE
jgi:branched-subunit amino acid aminotransferase/4-amino-4-deoxychorismate lyase